MPIFSIQELKVEGRREELRELRGLNYKRKGDNTIHHPEIWVVVKNNQTKNFFTRQIRLNWRIFQVKNGKRRSRKEKKEQRLGRLYLHGLFSTNKQLVLFHKTPKNAFILGKYNHSFYELPHLFRVVSDAPTAVLPHWIHSNCWRSKWNSWLQSKKTNFFVEQDNKSLTWFGKRGSTSTKKGKTREALKLFSLLKARWKEGLVETHLIGESKSAPNERIEEGRKNRFPRLCWKKGYFSKNSTRNYLYYSFFDVCEITYKIWDKKTKKQACKFEK